MSERSPESYQETTNSNPWDSLKNSEFSGNTAEHFDRLSKNAPSGVEAMGKDTLFELMSKDKHLMRILAHSSGPGFNNYQHCQPQDLEAFISDYPEPASFDNFEKNMLKDIEAHNPAQKLREYQSAFKTFRGAVYGQKQQFHDKAEELRAIENQRRASAQRNLEIPSRSEQEISAEYMQDVTIDGDPWVQDSRAYQLTPEHLDYYNLNAKHEINLGGVDIGLSDVFSVGSRDAVIAYVKTQQGVKARSYYRSQSQGVWRYLPDYVSEGKGRINWYGKGMSEEALTLPAKMQAKLNAMSVENRANLPPNAHTSFIFAGTAKCYPSKENYLRNLQNGTMRGDLYQEVNSNPILEFDHLSRQKQPPETLDITGPKAPDFNQAINSYDLNSSMYGEAKVSTYQSADGSLEYSMCENARGEAWLGGIESNSRITSTGLKADWVSAGDFGTPLYEYKTMADGYGDESESRGNYVKMWNNYLSRMPLIRRFITSRNSR